VKWPLFSPSSVFWRVNRELASGMAGPRAVLMQIAHPLVAAGVGDHSRFREARFARLYRTAMAAAAITFCSEDLARRAIQSINSRHQKVHGVLRKPAGIFPAGTPYDANDPDLKLWVLNTITDSTLVVYDLFIKPLSKTEREQYYRESLVAMDLFNVPEDIVPPTYGDFRGYMDRMLQSDVITVSDTAREIARALFSPSISGTALYAGSSIGIGLLPRRMQLEFGLRWSPRRDKWLHRTARLHRTVRRHIPSIFCISPIAAMAEWLTAAKR
jgi:uncharacterized protein (DUF2236 family)